MSARSFLLKLLLFFAPILAVYAMPVAVLVRAWELSPVTTIARTHAASSNPESLYGPAYGYPARGYKLASIAARQPPVVAIGSSRAMQFRADFFVGGESTFYGAGGIVERLFDYRLVFRRLVPLKTRRAIVVIDPWHMNEAWRDFAPDAMAPRDYDGELNRLDILQRSLRVYPDLRAKKLTVGEVFASHDVFGINAICHGNGFRRDGSYRYADLLRDPAGGEDYEFKDTLLRIQTGARRLEWADEPSPRALVELELLAQEWRKNGFEIVVVLAPFAPTVVSAMRESGKLDYVFRLGERMRPVLNRQRIPLIDLTDCGALACEDRDFLDGMHAGSAFYARMLLEVTRTVAWVADVADARGLTRRLDGRSSELSSWELALP